MAASALARSSKDLSRRLASYRGLLVVSELSRVAWDWWYYCDLILGQAQGLVGFFSSWLGIKSVSGCSFLGPFILHRGLKSKDW